MDWKNSLDGATLKIRPTVSVKAPKCEKKIVARRAEDKVSHFIPLVPATPGKGNRLVAERGVQGFYRISAATKANEEADGIANRAAEEEAAADRKRQAMQARARGDLARRRAETRERCGIPPLLNVLEGFGLSLGKFNRVLAEDRWSGKGPDPLVEGDAAAGDNPAEEELSITFRTNSAQAAEGPLMPVVNWKLATLPPAGLKSMEFRHFLGEKSKRSCLMITCADAPHLLLQGKQTRRRADTNYRYLLGVKVPSSSKVLLMETGLFYVEHVGQFGPRKQVDNPDPDWEQWEPSKEGPASIDGSKAYWEQRNLATNTFGIAKRQRALAQASEKATKRKFAEMEEFASALSERAEALEANLVDAAERSENNRRKLLPPYNGDAVEPFSIYKEGLETICPTRLMQAEAQSTLLDPEMVTFLKEVSRKPTRANEYNNVTSKSKFLSLVISTRARAARDTFAQDTESLAMRLEVFYRLILFYKGGPRYHGGKYKAKGVANLAELSSESHLAKHWWMEYCTEIPNNQLRSFSGRKVLCALLVWALYLTPGLSMEINLGEIEEELGSRGELKRTFENIGCSVNVIQPTPGVTAQSIKAVVTLAHPPRLDMEKYEAQNLLSSKKSGKGRGRGRGR